MTAAALAMSLLGRPYAKGAQGPAAFDCWSLLVHVERELFGREIPRISDHPDDVRALMRFVAEHHANQQWTRADAPEHGGMVQMARAGLPFHCGIYLDVDGGGVLHCSPQAGVGFETPLALRMARWRCEWFAWRGAPA